MDRLSAPRVAWPLLVAWTVLLAVVLVWPMPLDPAGTIVGLPEATAPCHVWVLWWAQNHLGDPLTDVIFFPYGADVVTLYGSDVLSPILFAPLPISPIVAHNAWAMALLVAGGLGAAWLARGVGATWMGAMAGATVFETAPFFQHELLNGTTEMLASACLPWFAGVLWRLLEKPTLPLGLGLGLATALGVLSSAYNAFFLVTVGVVVFLHRVSTTPGRVLTPALWRAGLSGVALASVMIAPLLWLQATHGAAKTLARREDWKTQDPPLPDSFASLSDWLDPRAADIPQLIAMPGGEEFAYWTTCTVFLGFCAVGLGLVALWRRRHDRIPGGHGRVTTPFTLLVVVGVLLAAGPTLRWDGEVVAVFGAGQSMPALLVSDLFPPFDLTGLHAYRYASVTLTGLSALVALAVRRVPWGALIAVEALALTPVPWPAATTEVPESAVLTGIAEGEDGAVFVAPTRKEDLHDLGRALLTQVRHGRPIQDGGIHRRAGEGATQLFRENVTVDYLSRLDPEPVGAAQLELDLGQLREAGYGWVLVPAAEADATGWFVDVLGPAPLQDADWSAWPLPAPTERPPDDEAASDAPPPPPDEAPPPRPLPPDEEPPPRPQPPDPEGAEVESDR